MRHIVAWSLALAVHLQAGTVAAQPLARASTLEEVRACPRVQCELTLERGTVDGTRLRVGLPGSTVRLGQTGGAVTQRLIAVPGAAVSARRGRVALQRALAGVITTLAVSALIWMPPIVGSQEDANVNPQPRFLVMAGLAVASGINWQYQRRRADGFFEEAVTAYNRELPP